jgi:hypothetical protein
MNAIYGLAFVLLSCLPVMILLVWNSRQALAWKDDPKWRWIKSDMDSTISPND